MTGFFQERRLVGVRPLALIAVAVVLSGCNSTTYGTGTTPGMQTLKDLTGLAAMAGEKKEPIDYSPRPKIVAPPQVAQLPPPGSDVGAGQNPPNWPKDPDISRAKIRAAAAEREANGQEIDTSVIPKTNTVQPSFDSPTDRPMTAEEQAKVKKLFADARGGLAVDENGNPVRRYLSDPPPDYRIPDPTAPLEVTDDPSKKKKKFKWFWQ